MDILLRREGWPVNHKSVYWLRGKPWSIHVDNGPEFAGRLLDQWAYLNKIELDFSRPGKPNDTPYRGVQQPHLAGVPRC